MEQIDHPNVIRLIDFFEDSVFICFVMEYMIGDMKDMLLAVREPLEEHDAKYVMSKMLEAVAEAHRYNIIHRDIKLENFLVEKSDPLEDDQNKIGIRLADFGMAAYYDSKNPPKSCCGTVATMAPEVVLCKPQDFKVDAYALGIVLYELLAFEKPF